MNKAPQGMDSPSLAEFSCRADLRSSGSADWLVLKQHFSFLTNPPPTTATTLLLGLLAASSIVLTDVEGSGPASEGSTQA